MTQQEQVFEEARDALMQELSEQVLAWNFDEMMAHLKAAIADKFPPVNDRKRDAVRFFCRHYLHMHGQTFQEMRAWISGRAMMPADKIQMVLRVLNDDEFINLSIEAQTKRKRVRRRSRRRSKGLAQRPARIKETQAVGPKTSGIVRGVIDHTVTMLNSAMVLAAEAGVTPKDVFGSDRMRIRGSVKELFEMLGIKVFLPEPEAALSQPVTPEDIEGMGLASSKRRDRD